MPTIRTPGVWTQEVATLPPSIAEVDTAIPAFIGYTETAIKTFPGDLIKKPIKIRSLKEYEYHFGFPLAEHIAIAIGENNDKTDPREVTAYKLLSIKVGDVEIVKPASPKPEDKPKSDDKSKTETKPGEIQKLDSNFAVAAVEPKPARKLLPKFFLYYSVKLFFENGGGQCYIVCVGTYGTHQEGGAAATEVSEKDLTAGLDLLALEDEPTLIVIPEAVKLPTEADFIAVTQKTLLQCVTLGDRFAILDVYEGDKLDDKKLQVNRSYFGTKGLSYAAAYYPFVRTTINPYVIEADDPADPKDATFDPKDPKTSNVRVSFKGKEAVSLVAFRGGGPDTPTAVYNAIKLELKSIFVILPPSGAIAGVYAFTDITRGVWKAPANVNLANVLEPLDRLDNARQAPYNVDPDAGKSINVIRSFSSKGTLVWGARTLAGNDNEWRYIPVRRLFLMLEESINKSTYWAVFEPNNAQTWVKVRGMIENYLTQKWREGALAGATPKDAFYVRCGLGSTMDVDDILEGRMVVEIGVAAVRPAEFIIIRFSHKLQTS